MNKLRYIILAIVIGCILYYIFTTYRKKEHMETVSDMIVNLNNLKDTDKVILRTTIDNTNYYLAAKSPQSVCRNQGETACADFSAVVSSEQKTKFNISSIGSNNSIKYVSVITKDADGNDKTNFVTSMSLSDGMNNVCIRTSPGYELLEKMCGLLFLPSENRFTLQFKGNNIDNKITYLAICNNKCDNYYRLCTTTDIDKALKFNIFLS